MDSEADAGRTVAVVAAGTALVGALGSRLDGVTLRTAETAEEARGMLGDLGCVVVTDDLTDASLPEFVRAIRARETDLPVVAVPRDGNEALAGRLSAVDGVRYLPRDAGEAALADRVRDALEVYDRRREHARDHAVLDALFSQFPYHLYVKDERARHLRMTDVPDVPGPEEAIGKTDLDVHAAIEEVERMYEDDLAVIESGEPVRQREEHHHSEWGDYWAEVTKVPWRDEDGAVRGLVGMQLNVSERKELERKLEQRRTLHRRIAQYLAHDIRNPLTVAHAHLELARESGDHESFDAVEDALDRIEAVVDNMDVVIGDATADAERVPEAHLAEAVADAWASVDAPDARLRSEVPDGAVVVADPSPLRELLENMFRNAVEHGGSDVTVTVGTLPDGFYVQDDGVGLDGDPDRLMEHGETTDPGGSGLGLAIVGEIADTYDWTVEPTDCADGSLPVEERESGTGETSSSGARFEIRDALLVTRDHEVTPGDDRPLDSHRDVGDARPPGDGREVGDGEWVVAGGGENVWGDTNEHHFVYATVDGDVRITCRLADLERVEEYTKAGVAVRAGLEESDPFGFVGTTADHGSEVLWRPAADADTSSDQLARVADLPTWYRLERVGDVLTAAVSRDGHDWTRVDQRRLDLSGPVYAGLAVCSHDTDSLAEARFESVRVETLDARPVDGA